MKMVFLDAGLRRLSMYILTLPIEHSISILNGNLNRYMMINFEVIDAGLSGLRVIYISVLGKKNELLK